MVEGNTASSSKPSGDDCAFHGSSNATPIDIDNSTQTESGDTDSSYLPLTSRHTSVCWKSYKRKRVGEEVKAECCYCLKLLAGGPKAGTTHLKEHLKCCPKRICRDLHQTRLFGTNSNPIDKSETLTLAPYEFHQGDGRKCLAEMIILHEYPISMVEHYGFRKYSRTLQPGFKVPSRNTTRKDILSRYGEEKENLTLLLSKAKSKIALTTDMWTSSNQRKGYMAVTAHFIDSSWKLQSRILRFLYLEAPHTKDVLCEALLKCIYDWNLDIRVSAITLDNCSTNDALMDAIRLKLPASSLILRGKFLHIRCCAHILNLIVQDGLSVIGDGIERVRNSVAYWTSSVLRIQKFEQSAKALSPMISKKLVLDCKTRWNSTFEMLNVALLYQNVFDVLGGRESNTYKCVPTKDDWEKAEKICDKLQLFSEITHDFSGTRYPTANIYFSNVCEIKLALESWISSDDRVIKEMAQSMLLKYNKYWGEMNSLLAVAAVLDPRYKLHLVRFYYKRIYEEWEVDSEVEKVKDVLNELLSEYSAKYEKSQVSCTRKMPPPSSNPLGKDKMREFARYMEVEENFGDDEKSELDKYFESPNVKLADDFDILGWWKANGSSYPNLQRIAKDILTIPVSSVASESAFSTGGRVLSAHRSRLLPSTVEALMCAQNWIWTNIKDANDLKELEYSKLIDELEEEDECVTNETGTTCVD